MRTPLVLLKFVAKALGNAIGGGIAGDLVVEVLPEVAKDAWEWWSKDRTAEQCRAEVEAIAQAGVEDVRQQVAEIVQEVVSDKPLEVRQAVETYLTEVPASIRRSLRRASDPTGTTIPADLVPKNAYDLLRLLPARMPRFKPGSRPLFGVDWELEQLLGVGGFGEVWKARNPLYPSVEPVALKFCLDPAAAKVLRNEAAVLDRVLREGKHPGIVQLLRTYLSAEIPCLEYEYIEGGDLAGAIQEWHRAKGGPTPNQAAKVILRLAEIVGFAHKLNPPIVHRDLKPANILVQRTADGETHFKVADFGIGSVAVGQAIRETSRGTSRGKFLASAVRGSYTPLYASPQQMRGDPPDPRDDVYSLGVIWYQLLTGDLGNGRPGGSRWRKKLSDQGMPSEMAGLLESCFEDNPDDRPKDAAVLANQMSGVLASGLGSELPMTPMTTDSSPTPPPVTAADLKNAASHINHAQSLLDRREYDKTIEECNAAIRLNPSDSKVYGIRGWAYRKKGRFENAIADCNESLRLDPNNAVAYWNRGDSYCNMGDNDRAIADATEAIRLDPKSAFAYQTRGQSYRMKGDYDCALADSTQAICLDPNYAVAYASRAECYRIKGDNDRAIADATEAIRLDPNNIFPYTTRAGVYQMKGDYDRTIADATQAIRFDAQNAFAYTTRAEAYRMKGDNDRTIADATQAIRISPNFGRGYAIRAEAYRMKGDYDHTIADATHAIQFDPTNAWAYATRAEAYRMKGDYDRAIADATKAIRLVPKSATAYFTRADGNLRKNNFARAIADATEAIRISPQYAMAYFTRAGGYQGLSKWGSATADATKAISLAPDYDWAACNTLVALNCPNCGKTLPRTFDSNAKCPSCSRTFNEAFH